MNYLLKKIGLLTIFLFVIVQLFAQPTKPLCKDSLLTDSISKLHKKIELLMKETTELKNKKASCNCATVTLNNNAKLLAFTPLLLLLLFTLIFIIWMIKSNFTLEDALSIAPSPGQYEQVAAARQTLAGLQAPNTTPATVPDPKPQPSVSRLLAFLTGIAAIIIAICLVSYQGYSIFTGCYDDKQFDALWKILLGLGIGVIPYGINVWNGNTKEQSTAKS